MKFSEWIGNEIDDTIIDELRNVVSLANIHCVQKKTPTHIFFHISMNYLSF